MSPSGTALLDQLAARYGIETGYHNVWGEDCSVPGETVRKVLAAFGVNTDDDTALEKALREADERPWHRLTEPVLVHRHSGDAIEVRLRLPQAEIRKNLTWTLVEEQGKTHAGSFSFEDLPLRTSRPLIDGSVIEERSWPVPVPLETGYHCLYFFEELGGKPAGEVSLILTPEACYLPQGDERQDDQTHPQVWGPAVQLYGLRSGRNWGMGDLTDLGRLVDWCAGHGAGVIGLNPLHELFPVEPRHISPYSPASRAFLNSLYLDVEAVADFDECPGLRQKVASPAFQETLAQLRQAELVDYAGVAALKRPFLERMFKHFKAHHLDRKTDRGQTFLTFVRDAGPSLENLVLFQALQESFVQRDPPLWSWTSWPEPYRQPDQPAVREFSRAHADRVLFYQYLQWQTHLQLLQVKHRAVEQGLPIGLYLDIAVGSDRSGAEVWGNQNLYVLDMTVGCPPDECNQKGQNWGLPPLRPDKLREAGYAPFIEILQRNMQVARALRLDHVMGLMRLFWIPAGSDGSAGAYVRYPFEDLLGILALESQRNRCIVIGEDLGTVPDAVREQMARWRVLSYKLFLFERQDVKTFKRPSEYPRQALAAFSTHDLPTLTGFWTGEDIRVRTELNLYPNDAFRSTQVENRNLERPGLLEALAAEGLLPPALQGYSAEALPQGPVAGLSEAVYRYLSRTPADLLVIQPEDVFDQPDQNNVPGTVDEHPNWQRKLMVDLEDWDQDPRMQVLLSALVSSRTPVAPSVGHF